MPQLDELAAAQVRVRAKDMSILIQGVAAANGLVWAKDGSSAFKKLMGDLEKQSKLKAHA